MKRVMIALGGNAIKQPSERGTFEEQMRNVMTVCREVAEIEKRGYQIVITHGNGPQVGNLSIQQEYAIDIVPAQPLMILGAMTQGQIGYMLQQSLTNLLVGSNRKVVTIVTQVIVSKDDSDFMDPTKPVGPYFTEEIAKALASENGWVIKQVKPAGEKTWRRVVPSPMPLGIVEGEAIKTMVDAGMIIIASGGGGIPVFKTKENYLEGVEAVIDKDRAGAKLAKVIGSEIFLILTDVEHVMLDYGKPEERQIKKMSVTEAKRYNGEGHFGAGSMGPKVEAAIEFLREGGEMAIITSIDKAVAALEGYAGTLIVQD